MSHSPSLLSIETVDIRVLSPQDAAAFHELRLLAFQESPTAFGASESEAKALSLEEVARRLQSDEANGTFTLGAFEKHRLIGLTGVLRQTHIKYRHKANMWGVYVVAEWRGHGVGARLVDEAIMRARRTDLLQIVLAVTVTGKEARALYLSRGFEVFGLEKESLGWNGVYYDTEHMQMFLKAADK